ncbi:MAG: MobA/MobL family protein [Lachnospiraceae bacterium]|nr:MobA/MobL family protein [Lachnospiraceae bacterium]
MATYHFHVTQVSRGKGQSMVASAAYRAGEKLHCDYYEETFDYTKKKGVVFSEVLLPPNAPPQYKDRETLWNALEQAEKHPKAQLAYSFDLALPNELSNDENMALAKDFILKNFVGKGMVVDWAFHLPDKKKDSAPNPHIHILAPIRPLTPSGEWGSKQRRAYRTDGNGNRVFDKNGNPLFDAVPTTDWGSPGTLLEWRRNWAETINNALAEKGISARVDHRSYAERDIDKIPQIHEGPASRQMEAKGIITDNGERNRLILQTNKAIMGLLRELKDLQEWFGSAQAELEILEREKETTLAGLVMEYYSHRDRKAEAFGRGSRKAKTANLKSTAEIYSFLQEKSISSLADLGEAITALKSDPLVSEMAKTQAEIRALKKKIKDAKDVMELAPVYEAFKKMHFKKTKEKYRKEHEKELKHYYATSKALKEDGGIADKTFLQKCGKELDAKENVLAGMQKRAEPLLEEMATLKKIKAALEYSLGWGDENNDGDSGGRQEAPAKIGKEQAFGGGRKSVLKKLEEKKTKLRQTKDGGSQRGQVSQKDERKRPGLE